MSIGNRIKYAALGVALIAICGLVGNVGWGLFSSYQNRNAESREYAAKHDKATPQKPIQIRCSAASKTVTVCYAHPPESGAANEHTKIDLKAQQDVAEWTFLGVLLSGAGLIFTATGIVFVYASLKETRRAIDNADRNARDETRAYVYASGARVNFFAEEVEIVLDITNCGATPAKSFTISGIAEYIPLKAVREIPEITEEATWPALSANYKTTAPYRQEGVLFGGLRQDQENILSARGTVKYVTIFNEEAFSEFSFMLKYRVIDKKFVREMQVSESSIRVFEIAKNRVSNKI